jgi:hypothetical protein
MAAAAYSNTHVLDPTSRTPPAFGKHVLDPVKPTLSFAAIHQPTPAATTKSRKEAMAGRSFLIRSPKEESNAVVRGSIR